MKYTIKVAKGTSYMQIISMLNKEMGTELWHSEELNVIMGLERIMLRVLASYPDLPSDNTFRVISDRMDAVGTFDMVGESERAITLDITRFNPELTEELPERIEVSKSEVEHLPERVGTVEHVDRVRVEGRRRRFM